MITRDGLNKRSFVAACLDLVNPRYPQIAAHMYQPSAAVASAASSSSSSSTSSSTKGALVHDSFGITLVAQTVQLVTSPIARSSMGASSSAGDKQQGYYLDGGGGDGESKSEATTSASAGAATATADEKEAGAAWLNPADALPFVADPLLMRLAAQPHLLPRTGLLAPNDHLLQSQGKIGAGEDENRAGVSGTVATTDGGSSSSTSNSTDSGRYSLVALEATEASLLEELLPLPKPTKSGSLGGDSSSSSSSAALSSSSSGGGGDAVAKNESKDEILRRRGNTISAAQARAEGRAAASAFAPAVPPSRAFLLPPPDLLTANDQSTTRGSGTSSTTTTTTTTTSSSSSSSGGSTKSGDGGAASYKSRLFMNSVLGATAADAPDRLTYLDGGGGASAGARFEKGWCLLQF